MMCGHAKELIAASWLRELDETDEAALKQHLSACAECSAEMTALTAMWERLGDLPAPEPSRALDVRWQATLESLVPAAHLAAPEKRWHVADLWPRALGWQVAIAMACLVAGVAIGTLMPRHETEISQLRQEVSATKELVALSLLQQQTATGRLQGIDYSARMPSLEPQIVTALIERVQRDQSVNVRLAAIDALGKAAGSGSVLASLTRSLPEQDSPMVQAALIDYLVDARSRQSVDTLRRFERQPNLDPAVLERAHTAVQQLSSF